MVIKYIFLIQLYVTKKASLSQLDSISTRKRGSSRWKETYPMLNCSQVWVDRRFDSVSEEKEKGDSQEDSVLSQKGDRTFMEWWCYEIKKRVMTAF